MIPREIAEYFGVTVLTVYNWIKSGCPADNRPRGLKNQFYLDPAKVEKWIKDGRVK